MLLSYSDNKTGQCPYPLTQPDNRCENECRTDADCSLNLKCCSTDCGTGTICVEPQRPQEIISQTEEPAYTTPAYVDTCKFRYLTKQWCDLTKNY